LFENNTYNNYLDGYLPSARLLTFLISARVSAYIRNNNFLNIISESINVAYLNNLSYSSGNYYENISSGYIELVSGLHFNHSFKNIDMRKWNLGG